MQIESWVMFFSVALVATASPGPAVLLVTSRSLEMGPLRTLITIAGNVTGLFFMSLAAVAGLSAMVIHSSAAFSIIKVIGALYLVYLGVKMWRSELGSEGSSHCAHRSASTTTRCYLEGLLIAITNPKAILFTAALFPQFIEASSPLVPQFSVLVATLTIMSFTCLSSYAVMAHSLKRRAWSHRFGARMRRAVAAMYVFAGALMATTSK